MTDDTDKQAKVDANAGGARKRAYVKPAFRHETVFEVMALACGKISGTTGPCAVNRKLS
jgi:hypothetical protein